MSTVVRFNGGVSSSFSYTGDASVAGANGSDADSVVPVLPVTRWLRSVWFVLLKCATPDATSEVTL